MKPLWRNTSFHFDLFLGKYYRSDIDKGLVGEDDDASWTIEGTGAEKAIYEEKKNKIDKIEAELLKMKVGLKKKPHSESVKVEIKKEKTDTTSKKGRSRTVKREQLDDESSEVSFIDSDEFSD